MINYPKIVLQESSQNVFFLVHFGAPPFFDYFGQKKNPCKCFTHKGLANEAEGTRTLL